MKKGFRYGIPFLLFAVLFRSMQPGLPEIRAAESDACSIDGIGYSTLDAALSAVTAGKTIVLQKNLIYNNPVAAGTVSYGIDLAGHNLEISAGTVYLLAATGGRELTITNSNPAGCTLTLKHAVSDNDIAAATNYGAVYTYGNGSRIHIDPTVNTLITSNVIGIDAGTGNSIEIDQGTVWGGRIGINVYGTGSVLFNGDVYGTGSGAYALASYQEADIQVNGSIYSNGVGAFARYKGNIKVTNGITVYTGGSDGAYSSYDSRIQVTGDISAPIRGVFAEGGTIAVVGNIQATGPASIGVFAKNATSQATVTVTGSVSGARYGADAEEGANVIISGDAVSTAGSASYYSAAVNARYPGSMIMVGGKALAQGRDSSGIEVYAGGTAQVDGNIEATGTSSYGVKALTGVFSEKLYGSSATVNGTIQATKYILIGGTEKGFNDYSFITPNGYLSYTGAVPLCYVDVKMQLSPGPEKLPAPGNLIWDSTSPGKAAWDAVPGSDGYSVQLYGNGSVQGSAVRTWNTEYDFSALIRDAGTGSYTFRVTACGDGTAYSDSDPGTETEAFEYTEQEPDPGQRPEGVVVLEDLSEGDEVHATDHAVCYAGGSSTGTPSDASGSDAYELDYFEMAGSENASPSDAVHRERFDPGIEKAIEVVRDFYTWVVTKIEEYGNTTHIFLEPGIQKAFVIQADAGEGGSVSPEGEIRVTEGRDQTIEIYPDSGYTVGDILIDGRSTGPGDRYVFRTVLSDHVLDVRFDRQGIPDDLPEQLPEKTKRGTGSSASTGKPVRQMVGKWEKDAGKWKFRKPDGVLVKKGWIRTGGKWYHFDSAGYAQTGWILDNGKWYHCNRQSCEMDTGLYEDPADGCSYYLNADGSMAVGWVVIGNRRFYFNPDPEAETYIFDPATDTWKWNGSGILPYGAMLKNAPES